MTAADLDLWADSFTAVGDRFADLFARSEPRAEAGRYLRGLLLPVERKNGWQLAEAVGKRIPDATQRLLYHARWSADAARDRLLAFVLETFGSPEGIFATKAQLAERMVRRVVGAGLPVAWITADEAYGDSSELRASLAGLGLR